MENTEGFLWQKCWRIILKVDSNKEEPLYYLIIIFFVSKYWLIRQRNMKISCKLAAVKCIKSTIRSIPFFTITPGSFNKVRLFVLLLFFQFLDQNLDLTSLKMKTKFQEFFAFPVTLPKSRWYGRWNFNAAWNCNCTK